MKPRLDSFIAEFVVPLLAGGAIAVRAAFSTRDRAVMLQDAGALGVAELRFCRLRRAQLVVAEPVLPDPGPEELGLWLALANLLLLDHPDTGRVWASGSRWHRVEAETQVLLAAAQPVDFGEALARHLVVGALTELQRIDHIVSGAGGERRFVGQPVRRGLARGSRGEPREEVVRWIRQAHAPAVDRLLVQVLAVSPLTCLLHPGLSPEGWSPLGAAPFLHSRAYARAVCHAWAAEADWLRVGAIVAGSLLHALDLVGPVFGLPGSIRLRDVDEPPEPTRDTAPPADVGAVVGALVHLHVLKVLELAARINLGVGARDWAVQTFLALPLLSPWLEPHLGSPFAGAGAERRRWDEYLEHLRGLVPRAVVENLVAALVPRVVQRASA